MFTRTHEAQEPLATCCRAQRRERTEPTLTRGDPGVERRRGVSRGHSSARGTHERKGVSMRRAEGPNGANHGAGSGDQRTNEAAGRDNCGRHPGLTNDRPTAEGPQPVGVLNVTSLRAWDGRISGRANRRMRKTARPVAWEGVGAQSPAPDPIHRNDLGNTPLRRLLRCTASSKHALRGGLTLARSCLLGLDFAA